MHGADKRSTYITRLVGSLTVLPLLHNRPTSTNGSAFSKLAAGLSLTPLKDLAFAAGKALRDALLGGSKTLVHNSSLFAVVQMPGCVLSVLSFGNDLL